MTRDRGRVDGLLLGNGFEADGRGSPMAMDWVAFRRLGGLRETQGDGRTDGPREPGRIGSVEVDVKAASDGHLAGGHLLSAISTRIVGILREHYGRGPMKAKTYVLDDIIVVVMRGSGFTPLEQTIMNSGQPDRVIAMREDFQRVMARRYEETIEELTGRKVLAFLSQAHVEPDITMEIFFVDGPLEGFGAVEITEPE
jgi:uncharacterized protein YbcI